MNYFKKAIAKVFGIKTGEALPYYEDDMYGYTRITDKDIKGLSIISRDKQLKVVFKLYLKNPFAKAIVDTINDFIFGDGFKYSIETNSDKFPKYKVDSAMKVLDEFWKNNKLDLRLEKKGIDSSLNGMLILPTFVNKTNGEVKLGFIDPRNLDTVSTNPLDVEEITEIKLKGMNGQRLKTIKTTEGTDSLFNENFDLLDGECFYYAFNNVSNQPEGISDLLVSADMCDMLDQLLFNILKHSEMSYLTYQDVTISGGIDDTGIKEWIKKNPQPKSGQRFVHNDKIKAEQITADIKAGNSAEIVRLFKNIVLLSKRLPEHWFADGGNANLATAVEQGTAVFRMLKNRQQYWVYILEEILTFVLHKAFIHKREGFSLTKEDLINNVKVKIIVPEFEIKNLDKVSESINKLTDFLVKGVTNGWLTPDTAGKIFRSLTELFGYDIDDNAEINKLLQIAQEKIAQVGITP